MYVKLTSVHLASLCCVTKYVWFHLTLDLVSFPHLPRSLMNALLAASADLVVV